ncbi:hypothetical protein [Arcticibacterium luteifluviistationis]|uniref:Uncharacterized protein n=1 Tax=Arcticibacterium luteifluviistationis TaxID=1784714 RepID=A0A2Z4G9H2_9BACT|nr:hypothetical protein [Arcticibacterium luteifluviistationis]AWV97861.1 hypothetical protein DJ013_06640 [Arcticibacterium luteifluviistationis]
MRIPISILKVLTVCYISFALFPFFLGWTELKFGIPLCVLLLYGIFNYSKSLDFNIKEYFSVKSILLAALVIFIWVAFSGAGGMGYQYSDIFKSNTLVLELTQKPWPLEYEVDGERMFLSHYLGYYLPGPALVGFLGYKVVQLFHFFYTLLGISLGMFWLGRFTKQNLSSFALFFILFGGISTFALFSKYGLEAFPQLWDRVINHGYLFWLNSKEVIPLNYMAINDMLYWTPQHVIPSLFGIGLLLNDTFIDKDIRFTPFTISLLAIWSPLVLVGILPFFLFSLFYMRFKGIWNFTNLFIAPVIFGVVAVFLLAIESGELVKNFIITDLSEKGISVFQQLYVYAHFLFFEVLIWAIPIYLVLRNRFEKGNKKLFLFAVLLLVTIPLYRFGLWNDWCNRVSMPALVVLAIFAFKAFSEAKRVNKWILGVLFVLGTHAATIGIVGSFIESGYKINFHPPEESQVLSLPEICVGYPITQFVAHEDTFFFKYLAKKPNK